MPIQEHIFQDASTGRPSKIFVGITNLAKSIAFSRMRVSVAYATKSGCEHLVKALSQNPSWRLAEKRWLVSIDFGITEPDALRYLSQLHNSEVRVPNGTALFQRKLKPLQTFHPKTYVFESRDNQSFGLFSGSANLTFSGLYLNTENGMSSLWKPPMNAGKRLSLKNAHQALEWWEDGWAVATSVDADFINQYASVRRPRMPADNFSKMGKMFAEADTTVVPVHDGLSWATARYFWIETNRLYKNRGAHNYGNQLDCARGTRTYFGFTPNRVLKNTVFGDVLMQYQDGHAEPRSIRFGNNQMDKVNLPIPDQGGPASYDETYLLFERVGKQHFKIALGRAKDYRKWLKLSKEQGLYYQLAGGREYGFFS